jgi:hypothetical protein
MDWEFFRDATMVSNAASRRRRAECNQIVIAMGGDALLHTNQ